MKVLAIECSTSVSSLALLLDGALHSEKTWDPSTGRHEHALTVIPDMLGDAGTSFADLDFYAVGRGPGNYSGMRVAISIVQALALPDGKRIVAVSSGEALAHDVAQTHGGRPVAIVGDARRGKWWVGLFEPSGTDLLQQGDWSLTAPEELSRGLPPDTVLATPDWDRLESRLEETGLASLDWLQENRYPTARGVGRLAVARVCAGAASDPVLPLYMHQAV